MREAMKRTHQIVDRMIIVVGRMGLTYGQLELRTKTNKSTWFKILKGDRRLTVDKLLEFCIATRTDPQIFFEDERWEDGKNAEAQSTVGGNAP